MTSDECQERAVKLLTTRRSGVIPEESVRQADVWARLAVAAAITETGRAATHGDQ